MYGITNLYMIEDYSHYSIVKDLLPLTIWRVLKDAQNSTLKSLYLFECSTSGSENMVEVRRLELLTSGLQSPRSAN